MRNTAGARSSLESLAAAQESSRGFGGIGFGSRGRSGGGLSFGGGGFSSNVCLPADGFRNFKTRECTHFMRSGRCPEGNRCNFAHGEHELSSLNSNMNSNMTEREQMKQELLNKTRICRHWQMGLVCPHGARCFFAHGEAELRVVPGRGGLTEGDANGPVPVCLCLKPFSGCRLWPVPLETGPARHAVRPGETSGPPDASQHTTLLGGMSTLCASLFHANSWEADVKLCLHWPCDETGTRKLSYHELTPGQKEAVRKCSKSQVAVVARLVRESTPDAPPIYLARYANCFRGGSDANVHAEEFLLADTAFAAAIADVGPDDPLSLTLYMTYQPCHHSGGRVPRNNLAREVYVENMPEHATTCSERLRDWYADVLRPKGVGLSLVLADVYKATWDEELHPTQDERKVYTSKSYAARAGMRLLLGEGVQMRAMQESDWDFVVSLCDEAVRAEYARRGQPSSAFSAIQLNLRRRMDSYLSEYIADAVHERDDESDSRAAPLERDGDKWGPGRTGPARRLVRLTLAPRGGGVHLGLDAAAGGAAVRVSLRFTAAHVATSVTPVAPPRFSRGSRQTAASGISAGTAGAGSTGGSVAVAPRVAVSLGPVGTPYTVCLSLTPAAADGVRLQIVPAPVPSLVRFRLSVVSPQQPQAWAADSGGGAAALLEEGLMGLQYAKGPDGTRGFRGRGRGRARPGPSESSGPI